MKAAGIKVESVAFTYATTSITVQASNTIIERCKTYGISLESGSYNTTIRQCFIQGATVGGSSASQHTIENCIIIDDGDFALSALKRSTIRNNTFCTYYNNSSQKYAYVRSLSECVITNNIFLNTKNSEGVFYSCSNCTVKNNVLCCTGSSYETENITGVTTKAELFTLTGENDRAFQLKDDSPAKGYATDGGDCGAYGGRYPYVPSGYPLGIPHFNSSVVGTRPQSGQVSVTQEVTIQKQ